MFYQKNEVPVSLNLVTIESAGAGRTMSYCMDDCLRESPLRFVQGDRERNETYPQQSPQTAD